MVEKWPEFLGTEKESLVWLWDNGNCSHEIHPCVDDGPYSREKLADLFTHKTPMDCESSVVSATIAKRQDASPIMSVLINRMCNYIARDTRRSRGNHIILPENWSAKYRYKFDMCMNYLEPNRTFEYHYLPVDRLVVLYSSELYWIRDKILFNGIEVPDQIVRWLTPWFPLFETTNKVAEPSKLDKPFHVHKGNLYHAVTYQDFYQTIMIDQVEAILNASEYEMPDELE